MKGFLKLKRKHFSNKLWWWKYPQVVNATIFNDSKTSSFFVFKNTGLQCIFKCHVFLRNHNLMCKLFCIWYKVYHLRIPAHLIQMKLYFLYLQLLKVHFYMFISLHLFLAYESYDMMLHIVCNKKLAISKPSNCYNIRVFTN